ncbi:endolytic transglycosylase MltG [Sinirhodobacter populi]|uniref:Endolytic murein transglycosylase n=1 Tax=Paenirhodobacter populi TaxID=2306993 RepID=A0A443KIT5_9RHOB|nr:endolytic transglycosylase MltG [Sinirhodobacter populi]RWR32628.1 endolytic transglycosylase MltG [Sinirhodobacter populi]
MWRHIASNFLTLLIVILVALGGFIAWGKKQYDGPGPLVQGVCLRVEQGANFARVSEDLRAKGAISSAYIFRVGASYEDKTSQLKFGSYLIEPGSSMQRIIGQITAGGPSTCGTELNYLIGVNGQQMILRELDAATGLYVEAAKFDPTADTAPEGFAAAAGQADVRLRVTLVEGATSWRVAEALKAADFLEGTIRAVPDEGSLAPDSYDLRRGSDRAALIAEMQRRQAAILAAAWEGRDPGLPYDTPEEALVMASLIEKETGVPEERTRVASVFVNRLEQGMRLQTDPTVIYGVTGGKGVLGRGIRQSELQRRTPYNTYVIAGLPPTPIANPGRASILAAMHPDKTPYLYFVADGSGGHAFAETLEAHNANVARWRALERGQPQQQGVQN